MPWNNINAWLTSPYHSVTLHPAEAKMGHRYVWELPIRLIHFALATSITVLIVTGLYITYPQFAPLSEPYRGFIMGRFRQVHFIAGYVLLWCIVCRIYWFSVGNKYARSGLAKFWDPVWYKLLINQIIEYMKVERGKAHLGHNSLAGASYVFLVGGVGVFQVVTGFAMYGESNPGGFWDRMFGWVAPLLGGSFRLHNWHHWAVWVFIMFVIAHVYMTVFGSIRFKNGLVSSIISGDKFYRDGDIDWE